MFARRKTNANRRRADDLGGTARESRPPDLAGQTQRIELDALVPLGRAEGHHAPRCRRSSSHRAIDQGAQAVDAGQLMPVADVLPGEQERMNSAGLTGAISARSRFSV